MSENRSPKVSLSIVVSIIVGLLSAATSAFAFRDKIFSDVIASVHSELSHYVTREEMIERWDAEAARRDAQFYQLRELILNRRR